ncbi:ornithine cyclodeaminase family protein [Henriciella aquimarina]|uniref:ornithine cyclodeaminase family protein n=1 Tax=Henriciella aquimarina TaxID=545261 RepID=UPI000A02DC6F|nr:ornithine cyclodeaminase family protein [Henriciella aquimarina]
MILIDPDRIRDLLSYRDGITVMREAMAKLSAGETKQMLRNILPLDHGRMFGVMAGTMGPGGAWGSKLVSVTPERTDPAIPSHQGVVILFDPDTGAPACQAEAGAITAIRTASASAMATDVLARTDARDLAILGTGEQAYHHALAMLEVRDIGEIRLWGRTHENAEKLADRLVAETGIDVLACTSVQQAVVGADIICTVTAAQEPVLPAACVKPGAHINLVGSSFDGPREIDDALVAGSRFFADSRESVLAQGAELRHAIKTGIVDESHLVGEIGEVLLGNVEGRLRDDGITIYNSLGHIVQDIAAAAFIFEKARVGI